MVVYNEFLVIMVLVCCYSLLSSCSCTRQVDFKYISKDYRPSRHNYISQGYNNHDGMLMTESHAKVHKTAAASELDLSSVPRKLLVESTEMKKSHENKEKLSGVKDTQSRKSGLSSMEAVIISTSQLHAPENPRTNILTKDARNSSNRRIFSMKLWETISRPIMTKLSAESTPLHKHRQNLAGDVMEMDYSPAHKRPPIHN